MSREKTLVKNTLLLSIGTFIPKIASMITLPLLTSNLTKTEFGTYDLIITLVALLLPAVTLQIQSAAFRFLIKCRNDKHRTDEIITNIICFTISVSIIVLAVLFFALYSISISTRILISIYFAFDMILLTMQQVVRGLGKNLLYSISATISSTISILFMFASLLLWHTGLDGILLALSTSTLFGIIYLNVSAKIFHHIKLKLMNKLVIKEMLRYSWPMVPNNLSGWVLALSDRLVITSFLGLEANAVYAVANKLPNLFKTLQSTFTYAWQENASLSVDDTDSEQYYSRMFDNVTSLLMGLMGLLIASTPVAFVILIRGDYELAYYQMPILYIGMLFSCIASFLGGIYIAHMKTTNVGITTMIAAGCSLAVDVALVKGIGIYAGSISTLVSYLFLTIYRMIDIKKIQLINYKSKKLLLELLVLVIMCVLCYQRNYVMNIINFVFGIFFAYITNKILVLAITRKVCKVLFRKRRFL